MTEKKPDKGSWAETLVADMNKEPMYNRLLEGLEEKDREVLKATVENWLTGFGKNLLDPLAENVGSRDFQKEFKKAMQQRAVQRVAGSEKKKKG